MKEIRIYGQWDHDLAAVGKKYGGDINAHSHLDRANTFTKEHFAHVNISPTQAASFSLRVKQDFTGNLHDGLAYQPEDLRERMEREIERAISLGTKELISFIDVSPDIGLRALEIAIGLREKFQTRIKFRLAAYPIFGINKPERWEIFKEAAKMADLLGGLPSRDAREEGSEGADESIRKMILLSQERGKEIHFQLDQNNDPDESETERLVHAVHWLKSPKVEGVEGPTVWAIHVISPSCYDESRFQKLVEGMLKEKIGVVCCPSAAISMRQMRNKLTPTHSSVARILDFMEAGIPVRIGTDNIGDVFIPSGDGKIASEVWLASNLLRFYDVSVWAKVCAGVPLNNIDRDLIKHSRS
ncbi:MAG: hypothetical protein V1705_02865 [bacterium]